MNTQTQDTGMKNGAQMRITPDEIELIKRTFSGNEALLILMRKIFLPEIDPKAPIGQVIDLWLTLENTNKGLSLDEQIVNLKARNLMITHTDQCLMQLSLISQLPTPTKVAENLSKNSTK
jgi:hypothetical protein